MADPSSFMVGNAPGGASYTAPLVNFAGIGNLFQDYQQGQQYARQRTLQTAFPNGVPKNPDGSIDITGMTDTLVKLGGADAAKDLIPFALNQQVAASAGRMLMPGGDQRGGAPSSGAPTIGTSPATQPARTSAAAGGPNAGPANIVGSANAPGTSADNGSMLPGGGSIVGGSVSEGGPTALSIAQQAYGSGQRAVTAAANISRMYGVAPDQPLDRDTAGKVASTLGRFARSSQGAPSPISSQNEDPSASGAPTSSTSAQEQTINGANAAPNPGSGASGSPAPTGAPGGASSGTAATTAAPSGALGGLVPPGVDPTAYVQKNFFDPAQRYRAVGAYLSAATKNPEASKAYEAQATALESRGNRILDLVKSSAEPTGEMKNAAASGAASPQAYTTRGEEIKGEVDRSNKQIAGIQGAASQYERDLKPYLTLSRSLLNSPDMYSGTGGKFTLDINRVRAAFGDQKAAMLQEALQKVTASSVLAQMNTQRDQMAEAGGNSGRIFSSQVDQIEKAAPQMSTTLGGNRFLVEVSTRMGELSSTVAQMMRDYVSNPAHGHLDANFDTQLSNYLKAHPLFSKQEISHPELIGAPSVPPDAANPQAIHAWGTALGLKSGDAIRLPDGRIKALP